MRDTTVGHGPAQPTPPGAQSGIGAQEFRRSMRQLAGGVSVITAACGDARTGLTATSVVSLSLEPPELMVSINRNSSSWPLIQASGLFGVNVLGSPSRAVAERFSGQGGLQGEQRYQGANWQRDEHGVWVLPGSLAHFSCAVEQLWTHRTHAVIVGRVLACIATESPYKPLTYWNGRYGTFASMPDDPAGAG